MEHGEAVQQKAAERYLLNEMSPEARDAFEGHFFDCRECALDLRAAAAFIDEAKAQLPGLQATARPAVKTERRRWFAWVSPLFTPAFAAPAFAALLLVVGYENTVIIPGLRADASQPRLAPLSALHSGTRGSDATVILADRARGASLSIDLPNATGVNSLKVVLLDPAGKQWMTAIVAAPGENEDKQESLGLPAARLTQGVYTLTISTEDGANSRELSRKKFEIQLPH